MHAPRFTTELATRIATHARRIATKLASRIATHAQHIAMPSLKLALLTRDMISVILILHTREDDLSDSNTGYF